MRLGIMQPYYFPYLGHFSLVNLCDQWIFFDITQYTKKSYLTRNEILKADGGRQFIMVEVDNPTTKKKISEINVKSLATTRDSLLGSLSHYRRAPNYTAMINVLDRIFCIAISSINLDTGKLRLADFNALSLSEICKLLEINTIFQKASDLKITFPEGMDSGDWAPEICRFLKAKTYVNPEGGKHLFEPKKFDKYKIKLEFYRYLPFIYSHPKIPFQTNLSIIDVLMWNDIPLIKRYIDYHKRIHEELYYD